MIVSPGVEVAVLGARSRGCAVTARADDGISSLHFPSREGIRRDSHRARRPRAKDALRETAAEFGVCVRPLPLRRVDLGTGEVEIKDLACGSTRAAVCPSCAARARRLRAQQCREGWHLTDQPDLAPDPPSRRQRELVKDRADITAAVEDAETHPDALTAQACTQSGSSDLSVGAVCPVGAGA